MKRCLVFAALMATAVGIAPAVASQPLTDENPTPAVPTSTVADACTRFAAALNLAASSYDEFAYATAGKGDFINYSDPNVWRTNLVGRTALREAAHTALTVSRAPGLPAEVSDAMRAWSVRAAKLVIAMGLRRGGDALNATATELNDDASGAQFACARNGAQA